MTKDGTKKLSRGVADFGVHLTDLTLKLYGQSPSAAATLTREVAGSAAGPKLGRDSFSVS